MLKNENPISKSNLFHHKIFLIEEIEILTQESIFIKEAQSLSRSLVRILGLQLGDKFHNLSPRLAQSFQPAIGPV